MFTKKQISIAVLSVINLISQIFIYLLHQDKLNTVGIEAIKELEFYMLIPAILLVILSLIKLKTSRKFIQFFGLVSLSVVIYIMSAHTGNREAISLLTYPQYLTGLFSSIAIIVVSL